MPPQYSLASTPSIPDLYLRSCHVLLTRSTQGGAEFRPCRDASLGVKELNVNRSVTVQLLPSRSLLPPSDRSALPQFDVGSLSRLLRAGNTLRFRFVGLRKGKAG